MNKNTEIILGDPSVRLFCKDIINLALKRDIVDAIRDVELALITLKIELGDALYPDRVREGERWVLKGGSDGI